MSGIKLESLEASDMLDVLHYLFEEDLAVTSAEQLDAKNKYRASIYKNFYETDYVYGSLTGTPSYDYDSEVMDDPVNMQPSIKKTTKPYMAPTPFNPDSPNPFGGALREAPLG
jgi:hypothetical protein